MRYSAARSKLVYLCPCCRCGCSAEGDSSTKFNALRSHLRSAHSVSDEQLERFIEMADTAVEEAGGRRRQRQQRATPPAASKEDEQAEAPRSTRTSLTSRVRIPDFAAEADILLLPPTAESPGEEQQQFRCQACHVTAASLEELLRHQREAGHHRLLVDRQGQAAPGYLCWRKGCNQYFPDLDTLQMHFTEIHAKTTRSAGGDAELPSSGSAAAAASSARFPHACAACRLAFRDGRQLERHRRQHAASRLACLLCHQRLDSSLDASRHHRRRAAAAASVSAVPSESSPTGGCGEVYRCEQCQVGFGAQIQLAAHMRSNTHKRLASCRCPLCGLACAGPEHLRSHAKSHQLPLFLPPLLLPFPLHPPHPTPSSMSAASLAVPPPPPPPLPPHSIAASSPNDQLIAQMSGDTGLPVKVIKHWFRNTLFKERQRCKDSPYNFSIPPATQLNLEEYEKTGKVEVLPARPEEIEQHAKASAAVRYFRGRRRRRVSTAAAAPAAVEAAEAASGRKRARIERRQPTPASQIPSDSSWLLGCRTAVAAEEEEENPELDAPLDLSTAGQQQQQRQQPQTPAAAGLPSPQQAVALRLLFEQQQQLLRIDGGAPSEPQVESVAAALGLPGRLIRAWLSNNRSPSPAASWLGLPGGRCRLCAGELPADSPASEHLYTERHLAALLRAAESAAEDDGTDDNGKTVREVAAEPMVNIRSGAACNTASEPAPSVT
uniref:Homeobox domain-containing protein n=1 Tax=Macrostomum lignano TaxID=282301 RepID=A0A1I8ISM3_9PLAT